jgi:hypothetical protein
MASSVVSLTCTSRFHGINPPRFLKAYSFSNSPRPGGDVYQRTNFPISYFSKNFIKQNELPLKYPFILQSRKKSVLILLICVIRVPVLICFYRLNPPQVGLRNIFPQFAPLRRGRTLLSSHHSASQKKICVHPSYLSHPCSCINLFSSIKPTPGRFKKYISSIRPAQAGMCTKSFRSLLLNPYGVLNTSYSLYSPGFTRSYQHFTPMG